jgi:hypothetical protein
MSSIYYQGEVRFTVEVNGDVYQRGAWASLIKDSGIHAGFSGTVKSETALPLGIDNATNSHLTLLNRIPVEEWSVIVTDAIGTDIGVISSGDPIVK